MVYDSRKNATAASAGSILIKRMMTRGAAGVVTDGGFRDAAGIAELDFPVFHHRPSAPTNLTINHAIDINVPIGCGDAPIFPGDIMVGDGDGVICLPAHLAGEIAEEAFEMTAYEDFVEEQVSTGRRIFGLYPASTESRAEFDVWRKKERTLSSKAPLADRYRRRQGATKISHQTILCRHQAASWVWPKHLSQNTYFTNCHLMPPGLASDPG